MSSGLVSHLQNKRRLFSLQRLKDASGSFLPLSRVATFLILREPPRSAFNLKHLGGTAYGATQQEKHKGRRIQRERRCTYPTPHSTEIYIYM